MLPSNLSINAVYIQVWGPRNCMGLVTLVYGPDFPLLDELFGHFFFEQFLPFLENDQNQRTKCGFSEITKLFTLQLGGV